MDILTLPIADLHEEPENAREHPPENLDAIRASLERFGQVEPLLSRPDGTVIHENGRLRVMQDLGIKEVQVIFFEGSEEEARALGVVMNRTAELARWKPEILGQSLLKLEGLFTPQALGFDEKALGDLFPEQGAELRVSSREPGLGLGTPIIQYALIFDDEGQQQRFFTFLRKLKETYPQEETMAARFDKVIVEWLA